MLWIGIDVGGTFTDGVVYDTDAGSFHFAKAPSTPSDPTVAVLDLLALMNVPVEGIDRLVHGVTIGTNAVLQGKGAEVWMLVTKGFRDVLEIARTNRPVLYDIRSQKTPPLVPRTRALEISERLHYDGSVRVPEGFLITGDYWHMKGLEIMNAQDNVAIVANDGGLPAGARLPSGPVLVENRRRCRSCESWNDSIT